MIDWKRHFKNIKITVKLRNFQYRLLHNKIFCNDILVHWHKVESNVCNLCNLEEQSIIHLLCLCSTVVPILTELETVFSTIDNCNMEKGNIIFNLVHDKPDHIFNLLILMFKQYVFRRKCAGDIQNSVTFKTEAQLFFHMECYNAVIVDSKNVQKIKKKWSPIYDYLGLNMYRH